MKLRRFGPAQSTARAAVDQMRDWVYGSEKWHSMTVLSNGNAYGIKDDLFFSFPFVTGKDNKSTVLEGITLDDAFSRAKLDDTIRELERERDVIAHFL